MILCPVCGLTTAVIDTRAVPRGMRRRRHCTNADCAGRVTTLEFAVPDHQHTGGEVVIVTRSTMKKLERTIGELQQIITGLGATQS
jgi:transcriptional regulator NrdR family protein